MSTDIFDREGPAAVYARMRPDQRTAIGLEFIRLLSLAGDTGAPHIALDAHGTFSPDQVAALHEYAHLRNPAVFTQVMAHPVTVSSLNSLLQPAEAPAHPTEARGWRFWRRKA